MSDRLACRREALRAVILERGEGADAFLVASPTNVTYLTGFTGDSSLLLMTADRAIVISDGRYTEQLHHECPDLEISIRPVKQPLVDGVADVVKKLGPRQVAFEAAHLTVAQHMGLCEKVPTAAWKGVNLWVELLRVVKDEHELAAVREAVGIAELAMTRLRDGLGFAEGRSEKEVADALEFCLRRAGATGAPFPPIVAEGPNSALPHARPTSTAHIGRSDFVLVDWGATGRLYKSDLTRVFVTGEFTPQFEQVYRAVLSAQARAIAEVRPGRFSREIDAAARTVLNDAGYGEHFTHSLGHGIGLDLHEIPALGREPDLKLEPGMIFTIEPGVYLPGWGGVRIEDDVLVTPDGCEVLSGYPKDLDSIRAVP